MGVVEPLTERKIDQMKRQLANTREAWGMAEDDLPGVRMVRASAPFYNEIVGVHERGRLFNAKPDRLDGEMGNFTVYVPFKHDGEVEIGQGVAVLNPEYLRVTYRVGTDRSGLWGVQKYHYVLGEQAKRPMPDWETGEMRDRVMVGDLKRGLYAGVPIAERDFKGLMPAQIFPKVALL